MSKKRSTMDDDEDGIKEDTHRDTRQRTGTEPPRLLDDAEQHAFSIQKLRGSMHTLYAMNNEHNISGMAERIRQTIDETREFKETLEK